jgi:hypothetical protein
VPEPENVTRVPLSLAGNVSGSGLLLAVIRMGNKDASHSIFLGVAHIRTFLTNRVVVVGGGGVGVVVGADIVVTPSCKQVAFSAG